MRIKPPLKGSVSPLNTGASLPMSRILLYVFCLCQLHNSLHISTLGVLTPAVYENPPSRLEHDRKILALTDLLYPTGYTRRGSLDRPGLAVTYAQKVYTPKQVNTLPRKRVPVLTDPRLHALFSEVLQRPLGR